ncbi:MAG: hypothetical protein IT478_16025 [Xanthomonadales bacterium]|nr:hypothetical protein [Xanthomonadales bacterium]
MHVWLFRFLGGFLSIFCMLGGFAAGVRLGEQILPSGAVGVGPQGGWPALILGLGLGALGAALGAVVVHRLVPWLGSVILSDDEWQQHAAPLASKSRLYAPLLTAFLLPFLGTGIVLGFVSGMTRARAGVFGLEPVGWPVIFVSLGLAMVGVYLCALIGYLLSLLIGTAVLGREQLAQLLSQLPQEAQLETGVISRLLSRPINAISNRILGTNY